jgi:hypothetical protein
MWPNSYDCPDASPKRVDEFSRIMPKQCIDVLDVEVELTDFVSSTGWNYG